MSRKQELLRASVFPGVHNLPIFAAEARGLFASRGIDLQLHFTRNSQEQRDGIVSGAYDIAHSAIDNALALVDVAGVNVVSFIGLESGTNQVIVQSGIRSYEDLRGKTLGVDAPDTAFALIAYELLYRHGLKRNQDYRVLQIGATRLRLEALIERRCDFALLNLPFCLQAEAAGLCVLDDPHQAIGPYQGNAGFAKTSWIAANDDLLVRYIAGFIEGLRWAKEPANRLGAAALLSERMQMSDALALQCCDLVLQPGAAFAEDAKLDFAGLETVLRFRADFVGRPSGRPAADYIDETHYWKAISIL